MDRPGNVTQLLLAWNGGNQSALDQLVPLLYAELKRIARGHLRHERPDHTLQSTALVNEAYLRLVDQDQVQWQNRAHFLSIAAVAMRRILVDYARRRQAKKRGDGAVAVELNEDVRSDSGSPDIIKLNDALEAVSAKHPRQGKIVELRVFGGLTVDEVATALDISSATVRREWRSAKTELARELAP